MDQIYELEKTQKSLLRKGDENILKGIEDNDQWKIAFLRLISDVWEGEVKEVYSMNHFEIRALFKERYGYEIPGNLKITISEFLGKEEFNYHSNRDINGWEKVLNERTSTIIPVHGKELEVQEHAYNSAMEMMIPPKPKKHMAAGKTYPFTTM